MSIPISRPIIGAEEEAAVVEVLRSGMIAGGAKVLAFEEAFADFAGADHAVALNSGTSALVVGLAAAGVGPGDEVIVPSFTFAATANSVAFLGATPVFGDIDETTYNLTADLVEPLLTERTKAVMPVHLFGLPAPIDEIRDLVGPRGIAVYEDAAQAHGATWRGETVGSMGHWAAFSFYPTKNMTTGEGGMITTDDADLARRARLVRNQGMEQRYVHEVIGLNERMTDIAAAIGLVQLSHVEAWTDQRRANAAFYREHLHPTLRPPVEVDGARHVYHQYTIRPPDRERTMAALDEAEIGYGVYYPIPTHRQAPYAAGSPSLPVTERIANEVLSIPIRPDLTTEERDRVVEALNGSVA